MRLFAVDTSCMVAAVCDWHEHHRTVAAAIEKRLTSGDRMTVPAPALVETYAVLTRLPPPRRLAPKDAWTAMEANFVSGAAAVALDGAEYLALLQGVVSQAVAGGRTYDAAIAACARKAGAGELLTLNRRDFDHVSGAMAVIDPTA